MREGQMRAKLREAILAGFNSESLDEVLRDNDMLRPNIALGPAFTTRVSSLIDVARQEGWLVDLCSALAAARERNESVRAPIVAVQKWLMEQHDTGEVERQFQPPDPDGGLRSVRLLAALIAAVALAGVAAWMFTERAPQSSITTSGSQSPVFQGTKGDVNINFGSPPAAAK